MNESQSLPPPQHPSRRKVAAAFGGKAARYEQFAQFQALVINQIVELFGPNITREQLWADLGCGSGLFSRTLQKCGITATVAGFDIAYASLKIASKWNTFSLQGDIRSVPFKPQSLDGIVASSVLQWIDTIDSCLTSIHDCLKSNGVFLFSVFTDKAFTELNTVKRALGLPVPVTLYSSDSFGVLLRNNGFSILELSEFEQIYSFPGAREALKSMSSYGATAMPGKHLSRSTLDTLCSLYENTFRNKNGIPVTYTSLIGLARKE